MVYHWLYEEKKVKTISELYFVYYEKDIQFNELPEQMSRKRFEDEWTFIATVMAETLGHVYLRMQGEVWSPRGEARSLIRGVGADHTSMSIGDIIVHQSKAYGVDRRGFHEIELTQEAN